MNYFVTGGAGFIGSNYVQMLLTNQLGPVSKVTVFDKLTYAGNLENLKEVAADPRLSFVQGDICNEALVQTSISKNDIIVHFAAESHVDRSISEPSEFIRTNVLGTQVLLSVAVENGAKLFLHVSTDEVYGSIEKGSSVESDPLLPNSPYSASKAAADLLVRSYVQTFGLDARITRCCNNYGPNQYPEKLIPRAIQRIKSGKQIPIYGDGKNVREWMHVVDHCLGIQSVITRGVKGEIYNLGTNEMYTNLRLMLLILEKINRGIECIDFVTDRKGHDLRYSLDSRKSREKIDFTPRRNVSEEIEKLLKLEGLI
jgi:dTDP-glucose 4,6-dehydratase